MQQGPRVAVIGLDCGTPKLLFDDLHARGPEHRASSWARASTATSPASRRRSPCPPGRAAMTGKTPGQLGHLRVPQPQGHHLRGPVDRDLRLDQGAGGLGRARRAGQALGPDRRPAELPAAQGVPGLARRLLPDAAVGASAGPIPQELEAEIEEELGGKGQYIFDIPNFRQAGYDFDARPGLQDDRAPVPGRSPADPEQALGLLHAVRDRAGPAPSRVLAVLRPSGTRSYEAGQPVRGHLPGLLPVPGSPSSGPPRARCRTTPSRS